VVKELWRKAASHAVPLLTTELSLLLRTPQQRLPVFFSGPDNSQNCPFLYVGGSRFHLIHGSLGRRVSPPNGLTIGSAVFAQQTDRHTTLRATCSNRPHRLLTSYLRVMPTPTLLTSWGPLVLLCRMRCVVRWFWARETETPSLERASPSGRSWRPSRGQRIRADAGSCSSSSTRRNRRPARFTSGRCCCTALANRRTSNRR